MVSADEPFIGTLYYKIIGGYPSNYITIESFNYLPSYTFRAPMLDYYPATTRFDFKIYAYDIYNNETQYPDGDYIIYKYLRDM